MSRIHLSRRGQRLLASPPFPEYLQEHFDRVESLYDPLANPGGYIPLSVAENKLLGASLLDRMAAASDVPPTVLGYDSMVGSEEFRRQLARFMGRTFLGRRFEPEQLAVLAGAGSVLEILFHNLCDPGDAVLVPTPSYAGFWADLETRDDLAIVPVHTESADDFRLTADLLDRAVEASDRPVKALLFTSPNNPLGRVYPSAEIEEVAAWGRAAGIHVVFDEIYALSVFEERPFTSCARVLPELGEMVHVVWAFSKDFGASGLRCGVLVSENEALLQAVDGLAYWACCSGHTQHLLGQVIADDAWIDDYVARNQSALGSAYARVTAALTEEGIPFLPAEAGFFLLCDFRGSLEEPTWEAEHALWRRLLDHTNVNLTPGAACHNVEPGFLRLCFASIATDAVVTGVRRLGSALAAAQGGRGALDLR